MNKIMLSKIISLDKYLINFKKISFEPIDVCDLKNFQRLEIEVIKKELTFGNYQLKNALSYLTEHFDKNESLELLVSSESTSDSSKNILFAKMQSRLINRIFYSVIIAYTTNLNDIFSIIA
jgi:hypothetical protein